MIDTDENQQYFAKMIAFPDGYKCTKAATRPSAKHHAGYSHGGDQATIHMMHYTFYEDLNDYALAAFEKDKMGAERELEHLQALLKKKDDEIKSNSDAFGYGGGQSSG